MQALFFLTLLAVGCADKGKPEAEEDSSEGETGVAETGGSDDTDDVPVGASPYANCSGIIEEDRESNGSVDALWREEYDEGGNQTLDWVDENNDGQPEEITTWVYDTDGNEISEEIDSDGDGSIDQASYRSYSVDGALEHVEYDLDGDGEIDDIAVYIYNEDGSLSSIEYDAGNDGSVDRWYTATYDEKGRINLWLQTDKDGIILSSTAYDWADDGQSAIIEYDVNGDGHVDQVITYTLNEDGDYATYSIDAGTTRFSYTFTYNENGDQDVVSVESYLEGELAYTFVYQYSYDDAQRLDQIQVEIYLPEDEATPNQTDVRYHTWTCSS